MSTRTKYDRRHLLSRGGRGEIQLVEQTRIGLQRRIDLEHDVVAVELREILGHLALADGVVDRRVDQRRLDAEAGRPVAIDDQRRRGGVRLLIAGDVGELRHALQLRHQFRRPHIEFVEIGVLQGVLVLGPASAPADPDVLRDLEIEIGALDGGQLGAQPGDDLVGARTALRSKLQADVVVAGVEG